MRTATIALAMLGLAACEGAPSTAATASGDREPGIIAEPGETFMTVNGFAVGRHEVDQVFRNKGVPEAMLETVAVSPGGYHVLQDYALATELYRQAVAEKLHEDPRVQLQIAFAERQALSRAMQRVLAERELTDERVQGWIEDNRESFALPQKQGREIVVTTEAHARGLVDRIEKGEDFSKLARDHSIDTRTAPQGGFLGWFSFRDRPELGAAIFAHGSDTVLGPLESSAGWHVVEILDSRDATPPEEQRLIARAALEQKALADAQKKLGDSLDVEIKVEQAGGDPHLPEGHPSTEGEGSNDDPAPDGADAPAEDGAKE